MNRRHVLTTTAATIAAAVPAMLPGCMMSPAAASIRKAAPYIPPAGDAELTRLGGEFDRLLKERDTGGGSEALWLRTEAAADRIMAVPPTTMAGLALWARVMLWRFDPTVRGIVGTPPADLAECGVNEAFAIAAAIDRLASKAEVD